MLSRLLQLLGRSSPHCPSPGGLSRDHVIWGYRLFLDREPESEEMVSAKAAACGSTQALRVDFMSAVEFREKNPTSLAYIPKTTIVIKELEPGLRLFVDLSDLAIGLQIAQDTYEWEELSFVSESVKPGSYVLDVGANIGLYTIVMASRVGAEGHVYAFEPVAQSADLLLQSVRENGFEARVTLRRAAVGVSPGDAQILVLTRHDGAMNCGGGAYILGAGSLIPVYHEAVQVPMLSLDTEPLRRPIRFMKLDVEGAEPLVCRGAKALLLEDQPTILAEINPIALARVARCTPAAFLSEMADLGYECLQLHNGRPGPPFAPEEESRVRNVVFRKRMAGSRV